MVHWHLAGGQGSASHGVGHAQGHRILRQQQRQSLREGAQKNRKTGCRPSNCRKRVSSPMTKEEWSCRRQSSGPVAVSCESKSFSSSILRRYGLVDYKIDPIECSHEGCKRSNREVPAHARRSTISLIRHSPGLRQDFLSSSRPMLDYTVGVHSIALSVQANCLFPRI